MFKLGSFHRRIFSNAAFSTRDEHKNGGVESITRRQVQQKRGSLHPRLALCFYPHVPLSKRRLLSLWTQL